MTKRIEITLPKRNVSAIAELLEDEAPNTCKSIWDSLPFEGTATHAMYCGHEVWVAIPSMKNVPGPENQTIYPLPGDILFYHFPARGRRGDFAFDINDFAIYYARDSLSTGPAGPLPGSHFASIIDNLSEFAKACQKLLHEGREKIAVKKVK